MSCVARCGSGPASGWLSSSSRAPSVASPARGIRGAGGPRSISARGRRPQPFPGLHRFLSTASRSFSSARATARPRSISGTGFAPTPYTATLTAARSLRDSVWVVAETPTHLKDSTRVHLIPQPAQLLKVAGDNQGGVIGGTLGAPLVVRVLDALGAGFKGDTVRWSVSAGGATLSAPATVTNDTGYALVNV